MTELSVLFVLFNEGVDYYWSKSKLIEKISSIPADVLPDGVKPSPGLDATGLGQLFWYTIEGRDAVNGEVTGGWTLDETRKVQDFFVKQALLSVKGVAEVASAGGYLKEYQIEVDPVRLAQYNVTFMDVITSLKNANMDTGARTMEMNKVEYLIRGLGYFESLRDIEMVVLKSVGLTPVFIKDVAYVTIGPSPQRGYLDKNGIPVAGGVVISRFGENPAQVIDRVKQKIAEISPSLAEKKYK